VTYWQFHFCLILPAIGALLGRWWWTGCPGPSGAGLGLAMMAALALAYTTPWDNYLVARGVWSYQPERVATSWRIGYVPPEEYLFFVLQPIFTGLCLLLFYAPPDPDRPPWDLPARPWRFRLAGGSIVAVLGAVGVLGFAAGGRWLYAGLILVWGAPPLALHWFYGGDTLWSLRRMAIPAFLLSTGYLWVADRIAIGAGIWSISTRYSTGWTLLGLPLEEALFFVVTNLLVIQALLLFFRWTRSPRGRAFLRL
jgi:lycopene cyclase domain-containing protein